MMPDRGAARADSAVPRPTSSVLVRIVAGAAVLLALLVAAGTAQASAPDARSVTVSGASPVRASGDVDTLVKQALQQLASGPVAVLAGSGADRSALQAVVTDAASRDLALWIVSIGPEAALTEQQNIAVGDRVLAEKHGTVLALSTEWIAVRSDGYTSDQLQSASDAASAAGSDVSAARAAVESLTATAFPWGWLILGVIIAVIVLALVGGWWERRRRRRADAEELARLTGELADRVNALAPAIITLSDQVTLTGKADLVDRFNRASAD